MALVHDIVASPKTPTGALGQIFEAASNESFSGIPAGMTVLSEIISGWGGVTEITPTVLKTVVTFSTGEEVIPDTDISVYRMLALRDGGMSVAEIMIDFPGLSERQIEAAVLRARSEPYYGKRYPRKTLKHFLRKGSFGRLKRELAEIEADA